MESMQQTTESIEHYQACASAVWGSEAKVIKDGDNLWITVGGIIQRNELGCTPVEAILPPNVQGRLKGALDESVSARRLGQLIRRDEKTITTTKELIEEARQFGSEILHISYEQQNKSDRYEVKYQLKKPTGLLSNWQSASRVRETNFGRTGIKADQLMILCAFEELFPKNEVNKPVIWREDVRTIFKNNKELDMHSINLLPELGGIQVEYQGHQSHRDEESRTWELDREKAAEAEKKGHFFMQIPVVNHMSPEKALTAAKKGIEDFDREEKKFFLQYLNPNPKVDSIRAQFLLRLPERAQQVTNRLEEYCESKGHKLLTEKTQFLMTDEISYACGSCGELNQTKVKTMLETDTEYCKHCKGIPVSAKNQEEREKKYKGELGAIWDRLPDRVQKHVIEKSPKDLIVCNLCEEGSSYSSNGSHDSVIEQLKLHDGFLCHHCLNTGKKQYSNEKKLSDFYQWKPSIITVMETTGWGDQDEWYKYIDTIGSNSVKTDTYITLNLTCPNGHKNSYSLKQWAKNRLTSVKRQESGNYCEECQKTPTGKQLYDREHLERLQTYHPNASFLSENNSEKTILSTCGETSRIGQFTIQHPHFNLNKNKLNTKLKEGKTYGQHSFCICCSEENRWPIPGSDKTMEMLIQRFKMRVSHVASLMNDDNIDAARIVRLDKTLPCDSNALIPGSEKLLFYCHRKEHTPKPITQGNFFNLNKAGYCPECLNELGCKQYVQLLSTQKSS